MTFKRVGSTDCFEGYNKRSNRSLNNIVNECSQTIEDNMDSYDSMDIELLESSAEENNLEVPINKLGYRAMTPEQAIKQANDKMKDYGISTEITDHDEELSEEAINFVDSLIQALSIKDPEVDNYIEMQKSRMDSVRCRIRTEGFKIPYARPYGESASYRKRPQNIKK
jgi:hypothetical protein